MHIHITGLDDQGRGVLVRSIDSDTYLAPDTPVRNEVWSSYQAVEGQYGLDALGMVPGQILWRVVRMDPYRQDSVHETATTDIDTVLSGSVDLVLETGNVRLETGDSVLIPGIPHGWAVGADGCVLSVVLYSAPS